MLINKNFNIFSNIFLNILLRILMPLFLNPDNNILMKIHIYDHIKIIILKI